MFHCYRRTFSTYGLIIILILTDYEMYIVSNSHEEIVPIIKKEKGLEQYNTMLFKMKFKSENMCNDEKMGN